MKVKLLISQWHKIRKKMKIRRIPDTINLGSKKRTKNYILPVYDDGLAYPRYHFETTGHGVRTQIVDIHIDWQRHKNADDRHPLLDELIHDMFWK